MENTNDIEEKEQCRQQGSHGPVIKQTVWLAVATVTYLVTLYLVQKNPEWSPGLKISLKLLPVLPGLIYLWIGLQRLRVLDELQRRIQLEAWFIAAVGTVVISTTINVLNANGIHWEKFPHGLEIGGTYLVVFFMWCMGTAFSNARYR